MDRTDRTEPKRWCETHDVKAHREQGFCLVGVAEGIGECRIAPAGGRHPEDCTSCHAPDAPVVTVSVPARLSHTGERRDKTMKVDSCIADLVEHLYPLTVGSCCGHGQEPGRIMLDDGRWLLVYWPPIPDEVKPQGPWGYQTEP